MDNYRRIFYFKGKKDECWNWLGSLDTAGYGLIRVNGELWKAHRYIYYKTYGEIKDKVLHVCNNTLCVNPNHLYDGSSKENAKDRDTSGNLVVFGRRKKLTNSQANEIRNLYSAGMTRNTLANKFNVSITVIFNVLHRRFGY